MASLSTADLAALSALLDAALALPPEARPAWLATVENERWREALGRMLADHAALPESAALGALPRLTEPPPAEPGERIGPWRLIEEVGRGGMERLAGRTGRRRVRTGGGPEAAATFPPCAPG